MKEKSIKIVQCVMRLSKEIYGILVTGINKKGTEIKGDNKAQQSE